MSNVTFLRKEFESSIGNITKEVEEKISLFGTPLERLTDEEVEVEIFPNRPDLLSLQGYARSFNAFLGKSPGLARYTIRKPEDNYTIKIFNSVKDVRPFTVCAIVKNIKFTDEKIKSIIDLQEKLHFTVGRNRKKLAIGVYPLEKITLPIRYEARKPKDIRFIPLEADREMDALQILKNHPAGRDYAHLLEGKELFPVFVDAKNKILSMPPIINSHDTGKVSLDTTEVFVECSGFDLLVLQKTLAIICATLADMGGRIYQMTLDYANMKIITPDFTPEKIKISINNINKLLGLDIKEKDLENLLPKMGYEYKNKTVSIPAWRTDILHEVDIIEDIAIAYGYDKIAPAIPNISTIGEESKESKMKSFISELLIGLGLLEISTYHLIKKQDAEQNNLQDMIELENSKTEYKYLRQDLVTPGLRVLSENKDNEYPQELFEIGTVFSLDKKNKFETGIKETENLCILACPGNFTKIKQVLDSLTKNLGLAYSLEESTHPLFIDGRTAVIKIGEHRAGIMGELHPETLKAWGIKMPTSCLELSVKSLF